MAHTVNFKPIGDKVVITATSLFGGDAFQVPSTTNEFKVRYKQNGEIVFNIGKAQFSADNFVNVSIDGTPCSSNLDVQTQLATVFPNANSGNGGSGTVSIPATAYATLTDAQIKTWPTTPIKVMDAPGAGKANILLNATVGFNIIDAYGNVSTDSTTITPAVSTITLIYGASWDDDAMTFYDSGSGGRAMSDLLLDGTIIFYNGNFQRAVPLEGTNQGYVPYVYNKSDIENAEIWILLKNLDNHVNLGDFTGGGSSNNVKVTISYLQIVV